MIKQEIAEILKKAVKDLTGLDVEPKVEVSADENHGDYASNIALAMFSSSKFIRQQTDQNSKFRSPLEFAQKIVEILNSKFLIHNSSIDRVEAVAPGFINFWLSEDFLITQLQEMLSKQGKVVVTPQSKTSKKIMVEYAHPNTHKEMHVGHMRTLITGEAIARLFEAIGNKVFRANYQGDIGPHVAKAIYGVQKIIKKENLNLEEVENWPNSKKADLLGRGYVIGNQEYEENKEEIDEINRRLYEMVSGSSTSEESWLRPSTSSGLSLPPSEEEQLLGLYKITRQWSLDYYDDFYARFYTKFDRLFFESEVAGCGKKIVEENVGKVFENDNGTIVFKGEEYGVHTRVFVTKQGYPTYEGKEMCLGFKEYEAFPFDKNIHVVGSEQAGYFKVVFKALELLDEEKFKGKEFHLSMGMVNIVGMKISSRTGEILRVDSLIEKVKDNVNKLMKEGKIAAENKEEVSEQIAIGAIKYSMLRVGVSQNVEFDVEKSVSLEGNSGPYIQYTYARTRSVLAKASNVILNEVKNLDKKILRSAQDDNIKPEELSLLRSISHFSEVVGEAGENCSPNILCNYLFDLSQKFNLFYQKHKIIGGEREEFRVLLTDGVGKTIRNGLNLLGIMAPERM